MTTALHPADVMVVEDDARAHAWVRLAFEGSELRLAGEAASAAEALDLVERVRRRAEAVAVAQQRELM